MASLIKNLDHHRRVLARRSYRIILSSHSTGDFNWTPIVLGDPGLRRQSTARLIYRSEIVAVHRRADIDIWTRIEILA